MKLYENSIASNPRRVGTFLAEKGTNVPRVDVSWQEMKGERQ